jgi:hypothetical protein
MNVDNLTILAVIRCSDIENDTLMEVLAPSPCFSRLDSWYFGGSSVDIKAGNTE